MSDLTDEQVRNFQEIFNEAWASDFNAADRIRAGIVAVAEAAAAMVPRSANSELMAQHAEDTNENARLLIENLQLKARIDQMEAAQFIPGQWACSECGFQLSKRVFAYNVGEVLADQREDIEGCPNDGMMMRRVTWKEEVTRADEACGRWAEEARQAKEKLAKIQAKAEKFAGAFERRKTRFNLCFSNRHFADDCDCRKIAACVRSVAGIDDPSSDGKPLTPLPLAPGAASKE